MQDREIVTTTWKGGPPINLRSFMCTAERTPWTGGGGPAVPVSPGHVKRLRSYPPGHRRRR